MFPRFEQFISEKQYLLGVSPATVEWYRQSLRWLCAESPTDTDLKDSVLRMRTKGLKPSACNSYIRAINSFLHWNAMGTDVKCSSVCKHPRLMSLKEPTLVLPVYTAHQVQRLVGSDRRASTSAECIFSCSYCSIRDVVSVKHSVSTLRTLTSITC